MRYTPPPPDQTRLSASPGDIAPTRRAEGLMFLWLAVLVWPLIAVGTVAAYGFSIWMIQLLTH